MGSRSWVFVSSPDDTSSKFAFTVTQAYILQRFINACAGRGAYPIKFNGLIFTVPRAGKPGDVLELAKYRTQHHLGHKGAFLNECCYFWGAAFNDLYGWKRPPDLLNAINESGWHRWEFTAGYELIRMMLDYYEHTLNDLFLREAVLPFAHEILTFFDVHYKTDSKGKIVIHPGQALETWWDCTNPMPEIAGLTAVTERLVALPSKFGAIE